MMKLIVALPLALTAGCVSPTEPVECPNLEIVADSLPVVAPATGDTLSWMTVSRMCKTTIPAWMTRRDQNQGDEDA